MPKHYRMDVETGSYGVTGQDVKLTHTFTEIVLKKNWLLLTIYAVITVGSVITSYFVSGWISVIVSFVVAVATFGIGLRMLQRVVTTTNEVR